MAPSSVLDHALDMANRGFRVFPLVRELTAENKKPAVAWGTEATTDKAKIRNWFGPKGEFRECGYGIAAGNGWAMFDADVKPDRVTGIPAPGLSSLELAKMQDIEFSIIVATPTGGRHGYFKTDGIPLLNGVKDLDGYPGVDIRSDGGFVVGPGSVRADGVPYRIIEENPDAAGADQSFLDRVRVPRNRKTPQGKDAVIELDLPESIAMAIRWLKDEAPESVQGAGGGKVLFFVASQLKDLGISLDLTKELIGEHYNEQKASPPWPADEMDQKIENGFHYGKNAPGSKNPIGEFSKVPIDLALVFVDPTDLKGSPPPREWIVDGAIPRKQVTLLYGDGGLGKSLLSQQLASAMALGKQWLGMNTRPGTVLAVFCEDDTEELWRRQRDIDRINEAALPERAFLWLSADEVAQKGGLLMAPHEGKLAFTKFYRDLEAAVDFYRPDLLILDPVANLYGGKEEDRGQVTTFVNKGLKSLCVKYDTTVLALAHPSLSGMESGRGTSGSTGWNNAVRQRLYLTRPKEDPDGDTRTLESKKANYGKSQITLATVRWREGVFHLAAAGSGEADRIADRAMLAAMRELASRGERMSPYNTVRNFAPKLAVKMPETKGIGVDGLEKALERLLRSGKVQLGTLPDDRGRPQKALLVVDDPDAFDQPDDGVQE